MSKNSVVRDNFFALQTKQFSILNWIFVVKNQFISIFEIMSGSIGIAREKVRKKEERRKKKEEGKTLPMVALSPTFTQTIPTDMISIINYQLMKALFTLSKPQCRDVA